MKRILLIIILVTFKSYSQDFIGKWKPSSYEDEIAYYNKSTDSISYKNSARKNEAESFNQMSELILFSVTYSFESNGKYTLDLPVLGENISGTFKVDKLNQKIVMIDNKGKLFYDYTNEILFMRMKMETGFIKLGLTKVSN